MTEQPKPGEWWWVELWDEMPGESVPAKVLDKGPSRWMTGDGCRTNCATPISRIPDPPAPEPSERERVDARRAEVVLAGVARGREPCEVAKAIRASDESAGYVLAPLEGPGFEAMAAEAWFRGPAEGTFEWFKIRFRAALERCKETGR